MDFTWTKHRFSGGLLALDLANTVVHPHDPLRRIDRLSVAQSVTDFVSAAVEFRGDELSAGTVSAPEKPKDIADLKHLRGCIDDFVRPTLTIGASSSEAIVRLFEAAAIVGRGATLGTHMLPFGYYVSLSAMRLLDERLMRRCKVCPQCDWLFVDKSKNQSRLWCDMAVCGNRTKAKAHYARRVTRQNQTETAV